MWIMLKYLKMEAFCCDFNLESVDKTTYLLPVTDNKKILLILFSPKRILLTD
jgi:hypothetical protein